jgi:hypothetical protein
MAKNVGEIEKFTKRNQDAAGKVKEMTDISQSGLVPALTRTGNAIKGLGETIGSPLLAPLKVVVDAFASLIGWVNNIAKAFPVLTGILGGAAGIIGVAAAALGGLTLAAGGLVMGAGALAKGWGLLTQMKRDGIAATLKSAAGIQAETTAVQASTAAIRANAQARQQASLLSRKNQDIIDKLDVSYSGAGGMSAPAPKGTAVAAPGQQPGSTSASKKGFEALARGGLGATAAIAGLSAAMDSYAVDLDKASGPTDNLLAKTGELATSFLMLPPPMAAIAVGLSSWIQVIPQLGEAFSFFIEDLQDAFKGLPAKFEELFGQLNPIVLLIQGAAAAVDKIATWANGGKGTGKAGDASSPEKNAELAASFISTEIAKKGGVGSAGISYAAIVAEFKKAFGDKALTTDLEKALSHAYFQSTQNYKKNMEQVGKELANGPQVKDNRTIDERLTAVKAQYDLEGKMLEASTKQKSEALKAEQETVKGNVTASIQSEQLRVVALQGIENQYAAQRVQVAQDTYAQTMAIRQAEYEQTKALLQKQRTDPDSSAEKKKEAANKLIELEKTHTEASIAAGQKLTESISQELDKQLAKRTEYEKKIQDLSTQSQDVQRSTAEALRSLQVGAASEYDALKMKLADAQAKLREAAALMPTFPEKAMQLAKDAQAAFAGLGQNIAALEQKMRSTVALVEDAQRKISNTGLTGEAKFEAEKKGSGHHDPTSSGGTGRWPAERSGRPLQAGYRQNGEPRGFVRRSPRRSEADCYAVSKHYFR